MQSGDRFQCGQVVGVGGAVRLAAGRIEDVHGVAEPDIDPDGLERGGGGGAATADHRIEIAGVRPELGHVAAREPSGQSPDVRDRRGGAAREHVDHLGGDAPGGTTDRLEDVLAPDVLGIRPDAQVGERRPDAGALEHGGGEGSGARHAGLHAGHLDGQQGGVDPGQDGDVAGIDPALAPGGDGRRRRGRPARRPGRRARPPARAPARGPAKAVGASTRPVWRMDLLVDTACVVGEHVAGRIDDGGRAPVVDGQRVAWPRRGSSGRS